VSDEYDIYNMVNKRQCGTLIPAANDSIIELTSTNDRILSIDSSSFLGVHGKRGVDSFRVEEGTSNMIMDELLEALPQVEQQEFVVTSDSEDDLFDHNNEEDNASPVSSFNESPRESCHTKQRSITYLQNESDNSLDTLVDLSSPFQRGFRRGSGSTINDQEYEEDFDFTHNEVLPLKQRDYGDFIIANQAQYQQAI
jgi:hypothetical protein